MAKCLLCGNVEEVFSGAFSKEVAFCHNCNGDSESPCYDHLGFEYKTETERANKYIGYKAQITSASVRRLLKTCSLAEALTGDANNKGFKDHLGNVYVYEYEMYTKYGQNRGKYKAILNHGEFSLEEALTCKDDFRPVKDHKGKWHVNQRKMCAAWGQEVNMYHRLRRNHPEKGESFWLTHKAAKVSTDLYEIGQVFGTYKITAVNAEAYAGRYKMECVRCRIEQSFSQTEVSSNPTCTKCVGRKKEWDGKIYADDSKLAKAYGIGVTTFRYRISTGMSRKEACTADKKTGPIACVDHLGEKFPNKRSRSVKYGIEESVVDRRIADGWSLEEALLTPLKETAKRTTASTQHNVGEVFGNFKIVSIVPTEERVYKGAMYTVECTICGAERVVGSNRFDNLLCIRCGNVGKRWDGKYYYSDKALAEAYGISSTTLSTKQKEGLSVEDICKGNYKSAFEKKLTQGAYETEYLSVKIYRNPFKNNRVESVFIVDDLKYFIVFVKQKNVFTFMNWEEVRDYTLDAKLRLEFKEDIWTK